MAVDKATTMTLDSCTGDDLGGWGADYELFCFREIGPARTAGYDEKNQQHHLVLWGTDPHHTQPGLVLRYLHYFNINSGLTEEEAAAAEAERGKLAQLDGTHGKVKELEVPGVGYVNFCD